MLCFSLYFMCHALVNHWDIEPCVILITEICVLESFQWNGLTEFGREKPLTFYHAVFLIADYFIG